MTTEPGPKDSADDAPPSADPEPHLATNHLGGESSAWAGTEDEPVEEPVLGGKADWSIPNWIRHPRLEGVLGVRLADLRWADLDGLVSRRAAEDLSLEFKGTHYLLDRSLAKAALPKAQPKELEAKIAKNRRELVKDVTAFANAAGGLLIIGLDESDGRAHRIRGVDLDDKTRMLYLDVIMNATAPFLAGLEVGHLESPAADGSGCVLIFVPPSADSPHAVVETNERRLTYFVRDGARAPSLSESQVAVAYRDRFASRGDVARTVRTVFDQGVTELDREGRAWLAVAVSPAKSAVQRHLNQGLLDEFKAQTEARQSRLPGAPLGHVAFYGRGRIVLRDSRPGTKAKDHVLHLYSDGSAFAAVVLGTADAEIIINSNPGLRPDLQCIQVGNITTWAINLSGIVAGHAADSGSSGDLEMRCGIVTAVERNEDVLGTDADPAPVQHVIAERPWRPMGPEYMISGTEARTDLTPVQLPVPAVVGSDSRELVSLAAQLVNELVAEFGHISSEPLLSEDGFVDGKRCFGALEPLGWWAEQHNLLKPRP